MQVAEQGGSTPVAATLRCPEKAGWKLDQFDLIEANEAFSAQVLAVNQELGWNPGIVDVSGGANFLEHPVWASGCRVLVELLHKNEKRSSP